MRSFIQPAVGYLLCLVKLNLECFVTLAQQLACRLSVCRQASLLMGCRLGWSFWEESSMRDYWFHWLIHGNKQRMCGSLFVVFCHILMLFMHTITKTHTNTQTHKHTNTQKHKNTNKH